MDEHASSFNPTICVTHRCNLSCVYCYQHSHEAKDITLEIAQQCVDDIVRSIPDYCKRVCISFIGGEPLLRFDIIQNLYDYIYTKYLDSRIILFATTNGTLLTEEMKTWFRERKDHFVLGLSLDGAKETHDYNRSNSFDKIDIPFFVKTWPNQGPKMTISEKSIESLADNILFLHRQGFKYINGVNLAEGDFDWADERLIQTLANQLSELVDFYSQNTHVILDQMMGRPIEYCASQQRKPKKVCGVGNNTIFYDVDGKKYPCSYITPMTFSLEELAKISDIDFGNESLFIDEECFKNCYLYPVCSSCAGANYFLNHTFSKRTKSKCRLTQLIAVYVAELHARRILEHRELYKDDTQLYYLIQAIKVIREKYFNDFNKLHLDEPGINSTD